MNYETLAIHERLAAIEEELLRTLKAGLKNVKVVYGDAARVGFRPPAVTVIPDVSPIDYSGQGEWWKFNVAVTAHIMGTDPDKCRIKANELMGRASTLLVGTRTLNGTVRDVRRLRYMPFAFKGKGANQLFCSTCIMELSFRHLKWEE